MLATKNLPAIALFAIFNLSTAYAQSAVPTRPMPMPAEAVVAPIPTPLPNGGYCMRFFVQDKGAYYVCVNATDPKDKLTVDKASQPELYGKIKAMQPGQILAGNPQTKQIDVIRPVFSMIDMRKYADGALSVLEDASEGIAEAKESLKDEGVGVRLMAKALGITSIMNELDKKIMDAIEAMDAIGRISPRLPNEKQKELVLKALKDLEASIRAALNIIDKAIADMDAYKKVLQGIIDTKRAARANAKKEEENMKRLDEAIEFGRALRKQMEKEAGNIRMFLILHAP